MRDNMNRESVGINMEHYMSMFFDISAHNICTLKWQSSNTKKQCDDLVDFWEMTTYNISSMTFARQLTASVRKTKTFLNWWLSMNWMNDMIGS